MRTLAALTLAVSLAGSCYAEDWNSVHKNALAAVDRQDLPTAVDLFRKTVSLAGDSRTRAISENDLGVTFHQLGRDTEARHWLELALSDWEAAPNGNPDLLAQTAGALALVERLLGEYTDAEKLLRTVISERKAEGESHCYLLSQLGDLLREEGNYSEAGTFLREAAEVPGVRWRQKLDTEIALGQFYRDTGDWDAGIEQWTHAAALARENHFIGGEAVCNRGLGETWLDRGNPARSEPLLKAALALFEAGPQRDDAQLAATLQAVGRFYLIEAKYGLAAQSLERALKYDEQGLGETHPQVAMVLQTLAQSVAGQKNPVLANDYMARAERIMEARFGKQSAVTAGVLANWGSVDRFLNDTDHAAQHYKRALDIMAQAGPAFEAVRSQVAKQYAEVLKAAHRGKEAAAVLSNASAFH